jgi:hypothetical protein
MPFRALLEVAQAGLDAYDECQEAGRDAVCKAVTGGGASDEPAVISALRNVDGAIDALQAGTGTVYNRFVTRARTAVLEAQARKGDGSTE